MISRQELEGKWTEVKGRLQDRWGQLTDDDLQRVKGNAKELVGVIEQKTGESRRTIENFIDQVVEDSASVVQAASEVAREYAHQAGEAVQARYEQFGPQVRAGYEQAEGIVRSRPVESVAVAFGAGVIAGVVMGLVLKSR